VGKKSVEKVKNVKAIKVILAIALAHILLGLKTT
jgi:hypothetical protein